MTRPEIEALMTNRFTGKLKLNEAEWSQVRSRVSEYDKVFG
jgi:hypothetical protein